MREETRAHVRACIERLRVVEELDTEQAAEQLRITLGAVKTRLHRARQALRSLLEPILLADEMA